MAESSLNELLISASEIYYDYLNVNDKGIVTIGVTSVKSVQTSDGKELYRLRLYKKLSSEDCLILSIRGTKYTDKEFSVVMYDEDKKDLLIAITSEKISKTHGDLSNIAADEIKILIDLKFLVLRVKEWAEVNPVILPDLDNLYFRKKDEIKFFTDCSDSQRYAVSEALTTPFFYIWGAPGTGKTQYCLSNCVMNYIFAKQRVLVIAPTNNSVEQALKAVIAVCDKNGVERRNILRIGAISNEFARQYPEVCELKGIHALLRSLFDKQKFMKELYGYRAKKLALSIQREALRRWSDVLETSNDDNEKAKAVEQIKAVASKRYFKLDIDFSDISPEFLPTALNAALDAFEDKLREQSYMFSEYDGDSIDDISLKLNNLRENIFATKNKLNEERMKDALVVGMTVDAFMGMFNGEFGLTNEELKPVFAHIFLDEASYCNMAKAMTLFSNNIPVTFFGDHFQLPPVCEADDRFLLSEDNKAAFLFAQSALYIEELFDNSLEKVFDGYMKHLPPEFYYMPKCDLTVTYRFGQNLLDVLSQNVYMTEMKSAENKENLEIEYIDVKHTPENGVRGSIEEVSAIQRYLMINTLSGKLSGTVAILSPYRNQISLLKKECFKYVSEEIYTVHGSQGREWDTVIFSVCDTSNKYFVDSMNMRSDGKKIINTAVSRAKKRLILVLDYDYWIRQNSQLICRLLKIAEKI